MGLDIHAYSNLKPVDDINEAEFSLYCANDHHFGDLEEGGYEGTRCPHSFRRSYSGWTRVREQLAELAGWPEWSGDVPKSNELMEDAFNQAFYKNNPRQAYAAFSDEINDWSDLPLLPLIMFSDCDGAICTDVCKAISADLDSLELGEDLQELADLFRWAAENEGVVIFH